jgi:hypothetical protein
MAVDLIARVECRSGSTGEERPVAVDIGGRRLAITKLLDDAVVGSSKAGAPCYRRLLVQLADGTVLRLQRRLPDGSWRVYRL